MQSVSIASASASAPLPAGESQYDAGRICRRRGAPANHGRPSQESRDAFIQQLAKDVRLAAGFSLADLYHPSSRLARLLSRSAREVEIHRAAMLELLMDSIVGDHMQSRSDRDPQAEDMVDALLRLQRDGGLQIPLTMDTVKAVIVVRALSYLFLLNLFLLKHQQLAHGDFDVSHAYRICLREPTTPRRPLCSGPWQS